MSVETKVVRKDDFGSAGEAEPVLFSFQGFSYSIDLNKRNRETFERHMQKYIDAATPIRLYANGERRNYLRPSTLDAPKIREWAAVAGFNVGVRGRIPDKVVTAYYASKG